jgi:hypothetical protein
MCPRAMNLHRGIYDAYLVAGQALWTVPRWKRVAAALEPLMDPALTAVRSLQCEAGTKIAFGKLGWNDHAKWTAPSTRASSAGVNRVTPQLGFGCSMAGVGNLLWTWSGPTQAEPTPILSLLTREPLPEGDRDLASLERVLAGGTAHGPSRAPPFPGLLPGPADSRARVLLRVPRGTTSTSLESSRWS